MLWLPESPEMLIFLISVAALFVFVLWLFYKLVYSKRKTADNPTLTQQRHAKRWLPKLSLTNRRKRLVVLLISAAWISADILRISLFHAWSPRWWTTFCA